ncbi:mannitol dehydrogenase family protein [Jannaschia pohangensis]|uniref:Fructuronate reductase n=1 Tax=Jannaschia pohangensis TaxID=390807 RepID=A0A1I3RAA9_9RHOB|nr:mannitol dehydrogenase family protein [Jannaschia pohangensis]SFJ42990.1 fructuronate reductase [Jannaschia pohangensis]
MTGVLHFGLGAFHRAHQAVYTQNAGAWIEAVSMRDPTLADALNAQDGFALIVRAPEGPKVQRITAIRRAHALSRGAAPIAARLADPAITAVTITVTEKGYGLDRATGGPDRSDPVTAHDLAHPDAPHGLIGTLLLGLAQRRDAGAGPITVLSCDNMTANGAMLKKLTRETAAITRPDLLPWIDTNVTFPGTMVDRITPAASDETRAIARDATGRDDPLAIETEPFSQWVIEDDFAGPIPDWASAGAQIVPDVAPFEAMKLRMLNGAHSTLAYMGVLSGHTHVRDVMADPDLRPKVIDVMMAAAQTLPADLDTKGYAADLIARFENPAIAHRCAQIAMDGSQKLPQRIFAPALDLLAKGLAVTAHADAAASWITYLRGATEVSDPLADRLRAAVRSDNPLGALARLDGLGHREIFEDPTWQAAVTARL